MSNLRKRCFFEANEKESNLVETNTITTEFPKPNLIHQLAAAVSILVSLAFIGTRIPGLVYLEPCFTFTSIIFVPWPTYHVIQQYRGTFRRNAKAATMAIGWPAFCSVITGIALFGILGNMPIGLVFMIASLSVANLLISIINWHWQRRLRAAIADGLIFIDKRGFTVKELLLTSASISIVLASAVPNLKPLRGHQVSAKDAPFFIPAGASDITYNYMSHSIRYECTIDEKAFLDHFAEEEGIEPFSGGHFVQAFIDCSTVPYKLGDRRVFEGWTYSWQEEDRGRYFTYDRPTQRLYYYSHSR